jgi:phosphotransferase system enzyme I (PtsI)
MTDARSQIVLTGIDASPGIAIGEAYVVDRRDLAIPEYELAPEALEAEIDRFRHALEKSKEQLLKVKERISAVQGLDHLFIIDTHLMILEDVMIVDETMRNIREQRVNAEHALRMVVNRVAALFNAIDDEYIRERRSDLDYVADRVMRNLIGEKQELAPKPRGELIVVAHDLSPRTPRCSTRRRPSGSSPTWGKTSHTAIMARSLEIPAVVGLESITRIVKPGDLLIVDGFTGVTRINPDPRTLDQYRRKREEYLSLEKELLKYTDLPAETRDGYLIQLVGNVEMVEEIPSLLAHGATGIGLYRTEFLYMNRDDLPSEEEHYRVYREVIERVAPHPVVIRTLDIGGDKFSSPLDLAPESNPALGLRAIRFCLKDRKLFKNQLAGILRASVHGRARIMLPMISGVPEVHEAKEVLEEVKAELDDRGRPTIRPCRSGSWSDAILRADGRRARPRGRLLQHRDERSDPVHAGRGSGERARGLSVRAAPPGEPAADPPGHGGGARGGDPGHDVRRDGRRATLHPDPARPGPR